MTQYLQTVVGPEKMIQLGEKLAHLIKPPFLWNLTGDLGAGKTTLVRGFLRGMHYQGKVKSPTYTLVEPYEFDECWVYHFDLYRLSEPEELVAIGLRDYLKADAICLIEWPERGGNELPRPDMVCHIAIEDTQRTLKWNAYSESGKVVLQQLLNQE